MEDADLIGHGQSGLVLGRLGRIINRQRIYEMAIRRLLSTCTFLNNTSDNLESLDSPMQMRLINYLGLKKFMIDNFIFRRKPSNYAIRKKNGVNEVFTEGYFLPPAGYTVKTTILETSGNSVPVIKLTPLDKNITTTVVYAHGNASDLADSLSFVELLCQQLKAEYVIFDYSGYGESRVLDVGQEIICRDMEIVLAWLSETRDIAEVVLWGFSLGTFPVMYAASKYPVKAIVLQCPIASISCLFYDELHPDMKFKEDHFSNIDLIQQVKCKVLILHSSEDEIIPISHAKLLFQKYVRVNGEANIDFIEVTKLKHNSLHRYIVSEKENALQKEVYAFLMDVLYAQPAVSSRSMSTQRSRASSTREIRKEFEEGQVKQLHELRMKLMEAEIEDLPADMEELIVDQETQQISLNVMGRKMVADCFSFGNGEPSKSE